MNGHKVEFWGTAKALDNCMLIGTKRVKRHTILEGTITVYNIRGNMNIMQIVACHLLLVGL